ncbi:MAG: helix-turn-helix domain-containing protein [Nocardioidaceae bacterium]
MKARRQRRLLSPSQKYEMYVQVLTGQATQREAAEQWKVDRSTVTTICRTAKQGALDALSARPGRPGKTPEQVELEDARAEAERLRATVAEQAVALHLHEGKPPWG